MPAKRTTRNEVLGYLRSLHEALEANSADLGHLEGSRQLFEALVEQAQEITNRQAALKAAKQEASEQLSHVLSEGLRLANVLSLGVKAHYGIRSQKLTEFGMQPFRGRKLAPVPTPEPVEETPPTIE